MAGLTTTEVDTATRDCYIEEVAAMIAVCGVKHLPVIEADYIEMVSTRT